MEPTRWACFRYKAQACRLSFPPSFIPSGTLVRDFTLAAFSYLSGRLLDSWEGGWSPPSFDCHSPFFPPSFDCGFPFPPSFVPSSFFFFFTGLALATVASGDIIRGMCGVICKVPV